MGITTTLNRITQTFKGFAILGLLIALMPACQLDSIFGNKEKDQKILEDSLYIQQLSGELTSIYNTIDSAESLKQSFLNAPGTVNRDYALARIQHMDSMLNVSIGTIDSLKGEVTKINQGRWKGQSLQEVRNAADNYKGMYANLRMEIASLKDENVDLHDRILMLEAAIMQKDSTIVEIQKLRELMLKDNERLQAENITLDSARAQKERELEEEKVKAKKDKSELYYQVGLELKETADNYNPAMAISKKKIRGELYKEAYNNFKKASKLGNEDATLEMESMESNPDYKKWLGEVATAVEEVSKKKKK